MPHARARRTRADTGGIARAWVHTLERYKRAPFASQAHEHVTAAVEAALAQMRSAGVEVGSGRCTRDQPLLELSMRRT
jgi:hypothetical protein